MKNRNIEAQFLDADELLRMGEYRQAKSLLEEIIQQEPSYGRAHNHIGWLFLNRITDYARAERHLKLAMQYSPDYPAAFRNYAQLLFSTNRFEQLNQHVAEHSSKPGVDIGVMIRYQAMGQEQEGNLRQARRLFAKARTRATDDDVVEILERDLKRVRRKLGWIKWILTR